jgi:predicted nucleic acid-binding protein
MIYFGATFFVRLYVDEPGFEKIRSLAQPVVAIRSSILGKMETEAALHRQLREGRFGPRLFQEANNQFIQDCSDQFIEWLPLTEIVIERVRLTFAHLPSTTFLRTGDAIHLATAAEAGFKEIYANDRHLLAAASLFKLKGINPLAK